MRRLPLPDATLVGLTLSAILFCCGPSAVADHFRPVTLDELVRTSSVVFSAVVLEIRSDHVRRVDRGVSRLYAARHHLLVRVELPLRGRRFLEQVVDRRRQLRLVLDNRVFERRPDRVYVRSYSMYRARRGDRVLIFAKRPRNAAPRIGDTLSVDEIDAIAKLPEVHRIVERLIEPELKRLRAREGRCKRVWTYAFLGECSTMGEIGARLRCGPNTTGFTHRLDGALVAGCRLRDGRGQGPRLEWHRNGELLRRVTMRAGRKNGLESTFDSRGRRLIQAHWADGHLHGYWIRYFPSGKKQLEGFYRAGFRDGYWTQWGAQGRRLGQYRMHDGSGIERSWYENGQLRLEAEKRSGVLDGRYRLRNRVGRVVVEGQYLAGRRHGAWRLLDDGGRFRRLVCYRFGRRLWDTDDPATVHQLRCR
ncbi:MAG: hypothetical protein KC609_23570 [Myxococcales bacterium]|nr:hypothetical protein [Myxococcales bacterium]